MRTTPTNSIFSVVEDISEDEYVVVEVWRDGNSIERGRTKDEDAAWDLVDWLFEGAGPESM